MVNQTFKTSSRIATIMLVCIIASIIAFTITAMGSVDYKGFFQNILDWNTI